MLQLQNRLQQQSVQLRQELESSHTKSCQQLQSRLTELEASCRELTERKYKNESGIRDLKVKLVGAEEVRLQQGPHTSIWMEMCYVYESVNTSNEGIDE